MKNLICSIALILSTVFLQAQTTTNAYPIKQGIANSPTTEAVTNAMYGKFIIYSYTDTTAANSDAYIKHQAFAFISTTSPIGLWYRDLTNTVWLQLSVSGSPTVSSWLTRGNDLSGQSLPNRLGTKNGDGLNIITNDLVRAIIPVDGIVRSSSAQNKYVMIDTVGKELYYGDASGGSTPTWQQTLTAGNTLTTHNTVNSSGFDFTLEDVKELSFTTTGTGNYIYIASSLGSISSTTKIHPDSILIGPYNGDLRIDTLLNNTAQNALMGWTTTSGANRGKVGYITLAGSLSLSGGVLTGTGITGLTVGTTTIASSTSTRILKVNSDNTLGEYTLTGTGTVVAMQTDPTFITSITSPLVIGGTGTTSTLTYKTTTGVGAAGADHIWLVGNNGATEAMRILNSGEVGIGIAAPTSTLHVSGSLALKYSLVEADNYTILASDYTLSVNNEANNWTIILPDAATCSGRIYIIKRFDNNSTGTITVDAESCDVQSPANGSFNTTFDLTAWGTQNQSVMWQSNGLNWEAIK